MSKSNPPATLYLIVHHVGCCATCFKHISFFKPPLISTQMEKLRQRECKQTAQSHTAFKSCDRHPGSRDSKLMFYIPTLDCYCSENLPQVPFAKFFRMQTSSLEDTCPSWFILSLVCPSFPSLCQACSKYLTFTCLQGPQQL